jgi:hypothetical protein
MGLQHYTQDMSKIPLKYHKRVFFYTKYTHPTLICRGTRTDRRTENIYSIFRDKLLLLGEHGLRRSIPTALPGRNASNSRQQRHHRMRKGPRHIPPSHRPPKPNKITERWKQKARRASKSHRSPRLRSNNLPMGNRVARRNQ